MQPSRRAFLLGRRPAQTPWARFMQRLTLLCQGPCATGADGRAAAPKYGVALALDGAEGTAVGPCLRVDPANLSGLARLAGDTPRWRAQPGVPLAVLAQAACGSSTACPAP